MKRTTKTLFVALSLGLLMASCNTMTHTVGSGAKGTETASKRQWYILFGLIPLNKVDSKNLAGDAKDYTVTTKNTFLDQVIGIFTGIVTIHPATVTVTK